MSLRFDYEDSQWRIYLLGRETNRRHSSYNFNTLVATEVR
jgi:hypothetical protein